MLAALDEQARLQGRSRNFDETTLMTAQRPDGEAGRTAGDGAGADAIDPALVLELAQAPSRRHAAASVASGEPSAAPAVSSGQAPRVVGTYRIHRRLGRGGMGTVYRAIDPRNGREVAIKLLHASMCQDAGSRARFMREARAARVLSHPSIVAVHEVGEADGQPFIAMELVRGSALSRHLEQHAQMPLRDAVSIGLQLAHALAYAHEQGVIHRDIKPGNILLLPDGQTIKVGDFGIAHLEEDRQAHGAGQLMGTPQYMSPEQTRGDEVDGRSDLFSAGVVLYQMLAGERPFRGDSLLALAQRIATEDPPPLAERRPDVPPGLRRAVERCLAKDPVDRYASGHELAQVLADVLAELDLAERRRQPRHGWGLRASSTLVLGTAAAICYALGASAFSNALQENVWRLAETHGERTAQALAVQLAPSALEEDWNATIQALQRAALADAWQSARVFDAQGTLRASIGKAQPVPAVTPIQASARNELAGARVSGPAGDEALWIRAPLLQQGKALGHLELGLKAGPWLAPWREARWHLALMGLALVAGVSVATWVLAGRVARPLRTLAEALDSQAVGRWDPSTRHLDEGRRDEIGRLQQSFDAMARALRRRVDSRQNPPAPP